MKRITFMDGPLNGTSQYISPEVTEWSCKRLKSMLPPTWEQTTYKELVPGYWWVVKTELKEMGI